MRTVNVLEAKTHLSALLADVEAGEEILIARAGVPVAMLVRAPAREPRRFGHNAGKGWIADDFDTFVPEGFE